MFKVAHVLSVNHGMGSALAALRVVCLHSIRISHCQLFSFVFVSQFSPAIPPRISALAVDSLARSRQAVDVRWRVGFHVHSRRHVGRSRLDAGHRRHHNEGRGRPLATGACRGRCLSRTQVRLTQFLLFFADSCAQTHTLPILGKEVSRPATFDEAFCKKVRCRLRRRRIVAPRSPAVFFFFRSLRFACAGAGVVGGRARHCVHTGRYHGNGLVRRLPLRGAHVAAFACSLASRAVASTRVKVVSMAPFVRTRWPTRSASCSIAATKACAILRWRAICSLRFARRRKSPQIGRAHV